MPIPSALQKIASETSREVVYRQIKGLILDLTLAPGELLRDAELAERMGVSRTPVREALRMLEDQGLVQTAKNKWTRVALVDAAEAAQIYPVVRALHVEALKLAFDRIDAADLDALQNLNQQMTDALKAGDGIAAQRSDEAFHRIFLERAGNAVLTQTISALSERLQRIERAHFAQAPAARASAQEHDRIIEAVRDKRLQDAIHWLETNWNCELARDARAVNTRKFAKPQRRTAR